MTPKEKAIELINKFSNVAYISDNGAKVCVFLCVDEIIKNNKSFLRTNNELHNDDGLNLDLKYWQEVKLEIEKL